MQLKIATHIEMTTQILKATTILNILAVAFLFFPKLNAQDASQGNLYKDFKTEFMWEAKVKIGNMMQVGQSKRGDRRVIPIIGGTFAGLKIRGQVLPGGEDWQLIRPDGDTELNARYLLKTDDGVVIQVINSALIHTDSLTKAFYCKSVIDLEAPSNSPYDYLNHAIFIGTLKIPELQPGEEPYVIIGVYKLL